jgi:hypothetical protein
LDLETRQRLYSLLPPSTNEEFPHNFDVNPLQSQFGKGIEKELRKWQDDLKDGRDTKKWRDEAGWERQGEWRVRCWRSR